MKFWPIRVYKIHGRSMMPTFKPGERVIGWRWRLAPKTGQVIVTKNTDRLIIKRVKSINAEGYWLEGDNPSASTDSRQHGHYQAQSLEAIVVWPKV